MVVFDIEREINKLSKIESAEGNLKRQHQEDKLMHSVLPSDKKKHDQAEMIQEATNRGVGAFTPDLMFEQFVQNFQFAKQLYGPKLIRLLAGYDPSYIERNAKIPEFKDMLKSNLQENVEQLKDQGLIAKDGTITELGHEMGSMVLLQDLDDYVTKDKIGEKVNKHEKHYGERADVREHRKGDRYKDINIRKSVQVAIKRGHQKLHSEDLRTSEREGRGKMSVVLALDASASMKGNKLETCKKAGVALAHKATEDKDNVGLIVFSSKIRKAIPPCQDFSTLLNAISTVKSGSQTDLAAALSKSVELFAPTSETKHLIIVTDGMPTAGDEPEKKTLEAVMAAKSAGITISIVGIKLEKAGLELAKRITRIGDGKLSQVRHLNKLGHFILEDYYSFK